MLPTKFGVFLSLLESASIQGAEPVHLINDLLRLFPGAIGRYQFRRSENELGWVRVLVLALGFHYCPGAMGPASCRRRTSGRLASWSACL